MARSLDLGGTPILDSSHLNHRSHSRPATTITRHTGRRMPLRACERDVTPLFSRTRYLLPSVTIVLHSGHPPPTQPLPFPVIWTI